MTHRQLGPGHRLNKTLQQTNQAIVQTLFQAQNRHWLLLLLWMIPLLLAGFFDLDHQSLMAHDEGLYARRARVIVDSGDWIHPWETPHHKTPGPYWVVALFIQLLGRHEVAVRLPSLLASLGCIWLTYAIGRRLLSPTAALLGAMSLGVAPLWLQYSRLATPDVMFTGLILLAVWLLLLTRDQRPQSAQSFRADWLYAGAGVTLGLTVLMRSVLAVLPMACLLPYLLLSERQCLKRWSFYLGGLVGLLPTALWIWLCGQRQIDVLHELINFPVRQGLTTTRAKSPLFYLFNLLVNDFVWIFFACGAGVLLAMALGRAFRQSHLQGGIMSLAQPQVSLLLLYPLLYLGLLSVASTKLPHYAIPVYPFLALLTGYAMERLWQSPPRLAITRLMHGVNGLLLLLGGVLTIAALVALTTSLLPNDVTPYAPIALGLGIAWVGASLLWVKARHRLLPSWLLLLLLGHWTSLLMAWGTADLGNINPGMKALLIRDDMQPILQANAIDFSPGLNSKRSTLLRFYTPNPGEKLQTLAAVHPDDYLWIEENELAMLTRPYDSLGQIKQTHFVRIR